jgi:hypothetical protein
MRKQKGERGGKEIPEHRYKRGIGREEGGKKRGGGEEGMRNVFPSLSIYVILHGRGIPWASLEKSGVNNFLGVCIYILPILFFQRKGGRRGGMKLNTHS